MTALTFSDENIRYNGYEVLEKCFKEALYQSCLNYGSSAGGFTQSLMSVVTRTVELWAIQCQEPPL